MKKKLSLIPLLVLPTLMVITSTGKIETKMTYAASLVQSSLPTFMDIDTNSCSEVAIRSYYSSLDSLPNSEKTGTNLLKNLKPILRNNFKFYSYDNVWKIYEITDRDWNLSPAESITNGKYNADTKIIKEYTFKKSGVDPYVHAYYRDHTSKDPSVIADSKITAYSDHNATGINREHLWPQSHGFKADSGATGPAGTDLHHLVAADGYVNQSIHNNDPYGYVDTNYSYSVGNRPSTTNNKVGVPKNGTGFNQNNVVFEPQDQDKGDIARACFYMVAMYNNYANESNVITKFDANLELVMYATEASGSEWGSDSHAIALGNLKDLLEWNKLDPVDEYEIHRNDLIFNNFQHNRNPFIDFPEWADIIWSTLGQSKSANPKTDDIYKGGEYVPPEGDDANSDTIFGLKSIEFYAICGVIAIVAIIVIAIVYKKGSKKTKKKIEKGAKKIAKKVGVSSSSSSKSKKSSTTKKK